MNPPFSAIFLTTLIGAGQGLFLVLFGTEVFLGPVALLVGLPSGQRETDIGDQRLETRD